jgi:hypothetical protein
MARRGRQIPSSLHGHFARPTPNSFCSAYPLANLFLLESVPNLSLPVWHIEGEPRTIMLRRAMRENQGTLEVILFLLFVSCVILSVFLLM